MSQIIDPTAPPPDPWADLRVLIAGGFGFLGQHLFYALKNHGAIPIQVSRRTGCNLASRESTFYWVNGVHPDVIINVAAIQGGIAFQGTEPFDLFDLNTLIGNNLTFAAAVNHIPRLINVISSCAYPNTRSNLREADLFSAPAHESAQWYAYAKRNSVIASLAAREQYNMDVRTAVLPNLYGPGDHYSPHRSHALAALLRKFYEARENHKDEVVVWGTGNPIREWLYAEDAAEGILALGSHRWAHTDEYAEFPGYMNIGNGVGLTITELANLIKDASGFTGHISYDATKPDGPERKVMDNRLMRTILHWTPRVKLVDGIGVSLKWLEENYQNLLRINAL